MFSRESGSDEPAISGFVLENFDTIGSAPISARKVLPDDGGDDPTLPSDVAPDEIKTIVSDAVQAQQQFQSDSEGAALEREARIELQKQTGEAFRDDDDGVGPTLDDQDASANADMDVDDSAARVAPTEAVNPAYAVTSPPTKMPRTGVASEARKFFTGSVMFSDSSDLGDSTVEERHPPPPKARPASATSYSASDSWISESGSASARARARAKKRARARERMVEMGSDPRLALIVRGPDHPVRTLALLRLRTMLVMLGSHLSCAGVISPH